MKIYTNLNHEIIGYSPAYIPSEYAYEYDVEDDMLNGMAFPVVCGYRYEPQYELDFNEDGSLKYDEQGNLVYKIDEDGEKIFTGYAFYPFVDYQVLEKLQVMNDENEKKVTELQLALTQVFELAASNIK